MACARDYRLVIVRKNLEVSEPKQGRLFDDYRYCVYITNDWDSTPQQIVLSANDRCQQENVIAQLAALRALHAPVNDLLANGAYMLMTALAWNFKASLALSLEVKPGRTQAEQQAQRSKLLGLEFRTFVNYLLRIPAQVVKTARKIVVGVLAYNTWLPVFFRLSDKLYAHSDVEIIAPRNRAADNPASQLPPAQQTLPPRHATQKEELHAPHSPPSANP